MANEQAAARSYILTFYENVQQLNLLYAQYCDLVLINASGQLTEDGAAAINQMCSAIRQYSIMCHLNYCSISKQLGFKNDADADAAIAEIESKLIIDRAAIKKLLVVLNTFLLNNVISSILETSMSITDEAFNEQANKG